MPTATPRADDRGGARALAREEAALQAAGQSIARLPTAYYHQAYMQALFDYGYCEAKDGRALAQGATRAQGGEARRADVSGSASDQQDGRTP
jgi:hypothetical protein